MSDYDYREDMDIKENVTEPPKYRVILLNDDYTTFEFVIYILKSVFKKADIEAQAITLAVHKKGRGDCGTYSKEIAETKIGQVHQKSEEAGYPLRCLLEEE